MPLIKHSTYTPPLLFKNRHLHTIYPSLFRNVRGVSFTRERIDTPDGDFLDLDWSRVGSDKIIMAVHGLEGSSRSGYIPGILKTFNRRGWDGVAMNLRGCSGEPNRLLRFYHAGATEDLDTAVQHVLDRNSYTQLALAGFSIGGNLTLKYLGERGTDLPHQITKAAAISTPCDLKSCAWKLSEASNQLYLKNFLWGFRRKIRAKKQIMPDKIHDHNFHTIKTLKDYDDRYTAPIHGFADAEDYWAKCHCKQFLADIRVPTLLINALDDPFLTEESYPYDEAEQNPDLFLETPSFGGHVGFVALNSDAEYWHETRVTSFIIGMDST
jgi:predicted alpha/beta-fold hydrolase